MLARGVRKTNSQVATIQVTNWLEALVYFPPTLGQFTLLRSSKELVRLRASGGGNASCARRAFYSRDPNHDSNPL